MHLDGAWALGARLGDTYRVLLQLRVRARICGSKGGRLGSADFFLAFFQKKTFSFPFLDVLFSTIDHDDEITLFGATIYNIKVLASLACAS